MGRGNIAQSGVIEALEADGWRVHTRGWPDFICVKGATVKFVKVQSKRATLSPAQTVVIGILRELGLTVEVVTRQKTGLVPRALRAINAESPRLTALQLRVARARGEVDIYYRKKFLFVSSPYDVKFRLAAGLAGGRYRPHSGTWRFKETAAADILAIAERIYGKDALRLHRG